MDRFRGAFGASFVGLNWLMRKKVQFSSSIHDDIVSRMSATMAKYAGQSALFRSNLNPAIAASEIDAVCVPFWEFVDACHNQIKTHVGHLLGAYLSADYAQGRRHVHVGLYAQRHGRGFLVPVTCDHGLVLVLSDSGVVRVLCDRGFVAVLVFFPLLVPLVSFLRFFPFRLFS